MSMHRRRKNRHGYATLAVKNLDRSPPVRRKDAGCARGGVGKIGIGGIIGRIQKIVSRRGERQLRRESQDFVQPGESVVADDAKLATRLGAVAAICYKPRPANWIGPAPSPAFCSATDDP